MATIALLLVDVQNGLVGRHPHCQATLIECLRYLLAECRGKGIEVIYTRHSGDEGSPLSYGSHGWQIDEQVQPNYDTERVFDAGHHSAFHETGLGEYLQEKGITGLILAGMQTEFCVDATLKEAFALGYDMYVPCEGVSTFDGGGLTAAQINDFYQDHVWPGHYARVADARALLAELTAE